MFRSLYVQFGSIFGIILLSPCVRYGAGLSSRDWNKKMMNNISLKRIMALVMVSFSLFPISGCHKETDQDKIKKVIAGIQKAAEEKDVRKIMSNLSKAYKDPQGYDYETIKGLLLAYFFRHQKIHAYIPDLDVAAEDASGKAVFQAVLTGGDKAGSGAGVLPEALGMYTFEVVLHKEDGDWKITSARWHRAAQNGP